MLQGLRCKREHQTQKRFTGTASAQTWIQFTSQHSTSGSTCKRNKWHITGEYRSKNTEALTQKTTAIKRFRITYVRNCFCKNTPKERLYLHTVCKPYAKSAAAQDSRLLPDERKGATPSRSVPALPTALGNRCLLQLWPKVASPGRRSRKPKHFITQPFVARAAWHLVPAAVTSNLPMLLRGLGLIPQPTTAALVLVFSGLCFL